MIKGLFIFLFIIALIFIANYVPADTYIDGEPLGGKIEKIVYDKVVTNETIEYFGFAPPHTATADSLWQVFRIVTASDYWYMEWADGNARYDNKWVSRDTLTYQ